MAVVRELLLTSNTSGDSEGDIEPALREAGFGEEAIWDIGAVTAYYNMSNRMAAFAEMRPTDEFHTLGRGRVTATRLSIAPHSWRAGEADERS